MTDTTRIIKILAEHGWEPPYPTTALLELVNEARIEELEALLPQPGEVIPYKRDKFAIGVQYIQNRVEARLAELKGRPATPPEQGESK